MISTSKIFFTTIKTCVQYLNYPTLLFDVQNALKRILTNNVNLNLSTFIIYLLLIIFKVVPGIQFWITIMKQMPSHVSHADNFLEAAHCR